MKTKWLNFLIGLVITTFAALTAYILAVHLFPKEIFGSKFQIYASFLFSLTWGLIVLLVYYFIKNLNENIDYRENTNNKINQIYFRLEKMVEQSALFSDENNLEAALDILRTKKEGILWIGAKFVSKQLSKSFRELEFNINGSEYSEFSTVLYPECKKAIYLTSPFTPIEWIRELVKDSQDENTEKKERGYFDFKDVTVEEILNRINKGESLQEIINNSDNISIPHIDSLNSTNSKIIKKRLVVLPPGHTKSLIAQYSLIMEFINLTPNVETRFISKDKLASMDLLSFTSSNEYDFIKYDYAIFDNEVLLKWKRAGINNEEQPLKLIDLKNNPNKEDNRVVEIFTNYEQYWKKYITTKEMLDLIERDKENLISEVKRTLNIPHKYAYFCSGSKDWLNIVSKPYEYELGLNELNTLDRFLSDKNIEQEFKKSNKYNIILIGSGDGIEIERILRYIDPSRIEKFFLVDISHELLNTANSTGKALKENINLEPVIIDIVEENLESIVSRSNLPNLFFIIGNGAILSNKSAFTNIYNSVKKKDSLIITLETYKEYDESVKNKIINEYFMKEIKELFVEPLRIIDAYDEHSVDFIRQDFIKEGDFDLYAEYFDFKEWKNTYNHSDIHGLPDEIRIFTSLKTTPIKLESILKKYNFTFEDNHFKYFEEENCCGVLCRKK